MKAVVSKEKRKSLVRYAAQNILDMYEDNECPVQEIRDLAQEIYVGEEPSWNNEFSYATPEFQKYELEYQERYDAWEASSEDAYEEADNLRLEVAKAVVALMQARIAKRKADAEKRSLAAKKAAETRRAKKKVA